MHAVLVAFPSSVMDTLCANDSGQQLVVETNPVRQIVSPRRSGALTLRPTAAFELLSMIGAFLAAATGAVASARYHRSWRDVQRMESRAARPRPLHTRLLSGRSFSHLRPDLDLPGVWSSVNASLAAGSHLKCFTTLVTYATMISA